MSTAPRHKELADILQDEAVVAADALLAAQREQKQTGRPLWRLLLRRGLCNEEQLFRSLKQQVRVPVLAEDQLSSVVVPPELRTALPHARVHLFEQLGHNAYWEDPAAVAAVINPFLSRR